jgi:hypothetical protein
MKQTDDNAPDEVIPLPKHPDYELHRYGTFWHLRDVGMPDNALSREVWMDERPTDEQIAQAVEETEEAKRALAAGGYSREISHAGLLEGN